MSDDINKWKAVKPIFDELFDYPLPVALKKLANMPELSAESVDTVRRLLFGMHSKNTLIESSSEQILNRHLAQSQDLSGSDMGEYHLLSLISKGGMSSIYLAERTDGSIQKKVAIKVLAPWQISQQSQNLFNHEQTILAELRHPNIVTMHHGGVTDDGVYFMVMDYLENSTPLDQYVDRHALDTRSIVELTLTVAQAISYAHANLVIHRDLKASNLLVDDTGHVHVVDFGIASSEQLVRDKSLRVYTPEIASPEQIMGHNITVTTDVFSLAATSLTLLAGEKALPDIDPQDYDPKTDATHINQVLKRSDLPQELRLIYQQAMQTDPSKRYESMDHFAQDLKHWLHNRPISLLSDSRTYQLRKLVSRNPMASLFAALTLVVLLGSVWVVANYANNAYDAAKRADASVHFLTEIINQADPFHAKGGDITIKEILDANNTIPPDQVNGDLRLKNDLHKKLGEIYIKLGLIDQAIQQYSQAVQLETELLPAADSVLLKTKNQLASLYLAASQVEAAVTLSEEVLNELHSHGLDDVNLTLEAKTNLMQAYGHFAGGGLYDQAQFDALKQDIIGIIDADTVTDQLLKVNVMSRLAVEVQKDQDFERAENYFKASLATVASDAGKENFDYQLLRLDYAIAKIRQKKHAEAEQMLLSIIDTISAIDQHNSLLGRSWETYSSLLIRTNRPTEAIAALDQATDIFTHLNNDNGLYYALSKRAMYHYELYHFRSGVMDQLRFIPAFLASAGKDSPTSTASLGNLMFMLHSVGESELANQVMDAVYARVLDDENQRSNLAAYLAYSGVSNWYHGKQQKVTEIRKQLDAISPNPERSINLLLNYLDTEDELYALDSQAFLNSNEIKRTFINRLRFVSQAIRNPAAQVYAAHELQYLCEIDRQFTRFRNIEMKRMLVAACEQLYRQQDRSLPDDLHQVSQQIEQAMADFSAPQRNVMREQAEQIIASIKPSTEDGS